MKNTFLQSLIRLPRSMAPLFFFPPLMPTPLYLLSLIIASVRTFDLYRPYFWNSQSLLSSGQTCLVLSHLLMQWKWKAWLHTPQATVQFSLKEKRERKIDRTVYIEVACRSAYLVVWRIDLRSASTRVRYVTWKHTHTYTYTPFPSLTTTPQPRKQRNTISQSTKKPTQHVTFRLDEDIYTHVFTPISIDVLTWRRWPGWPGIRCTGP